jgi:uncharacterized protein (DUF58 family)
VSRWPRPARPWTPILGAVAVVGIWWLVAHNGGAGWVQFVGDLVFGALLVGVAGPAVAVGRARLEVRRAPADGVRGQPLEVHVVASTRLRVRPLVPPGEEAFLGPSGRRGRTDALTVVPAQRGVYTSVTLDVASASPFALQWWHRRVTLPLPAELLVAPRRGRPDPPRAQREEQAGAVVVRPRDDAGFPRGARPYVPGDARQRVHWRATAHTGALMVKELERPAGRPVTVVVDLPADPVEAEHAAEHALGTVVALLGGGATVVLATLESSGAVTRPVVDRRQARRRLARAVSRGHDPNVERAAP